MKLFVLDIDECLISSHDCHRDVTCMNMIGSFECHCNNGFTGDGRNCQSMDAEFIKAMTNLHAMQIPEAIVFLFYSSIYVDISFGKDQK